jgi:hypothetical protein
MIMPMTPAEFLHRMKTLPHADNPEYAHIEADELMCEALRSLGYGKGVDIFENMETWYA